MAIGIEGEVLLAVVSIFDRGPSADVLSARLERDRIRQRNNRAKHKLLNGGAKANDVATVHKTSVDSSVDGADERCESTSFLSVLLPEKSIQKVSKKEANPSARGTRLLPDWKPTPDLVEYARSHGVEPMKFTEEFVDFWTGVPGARGLKSNWPGTYRNRVRAVTGQTGVPNGHDRRSVIAAADRLIGSGFKLKPKPGSPVPTSGQANLQLLPKR